MTVISPPPSTAFNFERNMAALTRVNGAAADLLRQSMPMEGAVPAEGRDGSPTYSWRDGDGRLHWLGRTSMPTISSPALLEAYQPGNGNSLLVDIGQGEELKQLAGRLAPYQAVFVVIEQASQAVLALRLHDFSAEIAAGRIVLCAADDPWAQLQDFLRDNPGYLVPDRVLCRPWFEQAYVSELSGRLERLANEARRQEGTKARRIEDEGQTHEGTKGQSGIQAGDDRPQFAMGRHGTDPERFRVALVSNVPEVAVSRLADSLEDAAAKLGWQCRRHTLATPRWVHPAAIQSDLKAFQPGMCLVIGAPPRGLAFSLPECPTAVVCSHGWGLAEEWLAQVPDDVAIVVRSPSQMGQLLTAGIAAERLLHWPPAARDCPSSDLSSATDRVLVMCDGLDASPEAVGLNLDTHQKLWSESRTLITAQVATYTDDDAPAVLRMAARNLGIALTSEEVTSGLETRIRRVLGPATIREAILTRLIAIGLPLEIYGLGRFTNEVIAARHRGMWPEPSKSSTLASCCRAVIAIETGDQLPDGFLDCAAGGAALFQRAAVAKFDATRFAGLAGFAASITQFRSADNLARQLESLKANARRERPWANLLRASHTWNHRMQSLQQRLCPTIHSPAASAHGRRSPL